MLKRHRFPGAQSFLFLFLFLNESLIFSLLKMFQMISCFVLLSWFLSLALSTPPHPTFPSLIKLSCLGDAQQFFLNKGNVEKRCIFRNFRPWSNLLTNKLLFKKFCGSQKRAKKATQNCC